MSLRRITLVARTRWLDDEEQRVWRSYLASTQQLWERLGDDLEEAAGMPLPEYQILVHLSEAPDRQLRMSQLAEFVVHSRSRLTHTVTRMERRGLVTRRPCPQDRRGVLCELTDRGFDLLTQVAPHHVESVRACLFDPLTAEEVQALGRIMDKIGAQLNAPQTKIA